MTPTGAASPVKVAILDDYDRVALDLADWERLRDRCEVEVFHSPIPSDLFATTLKEFAVVCLMRERTRLPREVLEQLPNLRLIATPGRVNAAIDLDAATKLGILVAGTEPSGFCAAELTFALILGLARQIHLHHESMRSGGWQVTLGTDLKGKTLGVLGLGQLGRQVTQYAKAFGMHVIAWSQNLTPEAAADGGAEYVEKDELFRRSDFVSVHVRLSDRTRGLVGVRELRLMKKSAFLVNTSRWQIVDEAALVSALENGWIRGAGIDVYPIEPLPPDHPIRKAPSVLLTPHLGYVTDDNLARFYEGMVESIEAWLAGQPIRLLNG